MCKLLLSVLVSLLIAESASAGPLYGTVRIAQGTAAGVTVEVACPGFAGGSIVASAPTDGQGSYSLLVPTAGGCEMRLRRGGQVGAAFGVGISDNALKLDLTVDGNMNRAG
jgi:hypothetical protein